MKKIVLFIAFLPFLVHSQESNLGNWLLYVGNKKINSNWNLHHEVQYRNYDAIGDLEQLLLRTGIGYNLTENNNNILVGYGFIQSQNYISGTDEKVTINEHRIYQQFITRQKISRVSIQHRYRFEQRFVENDFKVRFRYLLGINIPLNKKEITDKTVYFSTYNEIFINSKERLFDRNRLYGGVGYKINNSIKIELGYMNQYLTNINRDQINIITYINF